MGPARRLMVGLIVLVTAAGGYALGRAVFRPSERVVQPIAFSHQKHVEELELECDVCHENYATGRHAGLPTLTICMGCHEDPQTEHPEEQKLREMFEAGEDDVFRKLFRLADHALYSHQTHVSHAQLECQVCHGQIASTTEPPQRPLVSITMDFCLDCHKKVEVSSDCTHCHR